MLLSRKRKRRADVNGNNAARLFPDGSRPHRNGRPGRPMKRPEDLTKHRGVVRQEQRTLHEQAQQHVDQVPSLSPFEQLPTELIQHIFFDALEPNLAMACTTMNQALSSESVFRSLLLLAYYQPRNYAGGISEVDEKVFLPARYRHLCHKDRLNLQRVITRFRWCNLTRIRAIMPTLSKLAAKASYERERHDRKVWDDRPNRLERPIRWKPPRDTLPDLPDTDDVEAMQVRYSARQNSTTYQKIEKTQGWPLCPQSGDDEAMPFLRIASSPIPSQAEGPVVLTWRMSIKCPVLGVLCMPGKVLRGTPWTTEKLAMLRLLRQGLRAEKLHLDNWEVAESRSVFIPIADMFEGMASAIRERNVTALLTLLELFMDLSSLERACSRASHGSLLISDPSEHMERDTSRPFRLPVTLLHLAAETGQWSATFLRMLIRADIDAVSHDDNVLTAWAVRAAPRSKFASWLLCLMEHAERELPRSPPGREWVSEDAPSGEQAHGRDLFSCHHLWQAVGYVHEHGSLPYRSSEDPGWS